MRSPVDPKDLGMSKEPCRSTIWRRRKLGVPEHLVRMPRFGLPKRYRRHTMCSKSRKVDLSVARMMRARGYTIQEIATRFRVSRQAVYQAIKKSEEV